jgi:hypothetical protein
MGKVTFRHPDYQGTEPGGLFIFESKIGSKSLEIFASTAIGARAAQAIAQTRSLNVYAQCDGLQRKKPRREKGAANAVLKLRHRNDERMRIVHSMRHTCRRPAIKPYECHFGKSRIFESGPDAGTTKAPLSEQPAFDHGRRLHGSRRRKESKHQGEEPQNLRMERSKKGY